MKNVITAPIRWTGSKKKLLNEMLLTFDKEQSVYVEPFLGSGTVLINVLSQNMYKKYYVNDINSNLINFYQILKTEKEKLFQIIISICQQYNQLENISEKEIYYYEMRKKFNERRIKVHKRAAVFWFLMKSGFNGVYRVNLNNKFNVPFGKKEKILFNLENAKTISELIQNVEFFNLDYITFLETVSNKESFNEAFLYFDPPYLPENNLVRQQLYTKDKFEHERFIDHILAYNRKFRELTFMISMSDSTYANEIYQSEYTYRVDVREIIRIVNPTKLVRSKEIAYINYKLKIEDRKHR
ncbi:Dam family site-specific DNA-(adenine-N6)-methyltransferase [Listeria welshimeri]|uniref:DNA adenine methylase n=1 Tax=Listeria welshimeri TaxID=1643 RepID=UPI0016284021|nr:Dam family site-specific DNA-(adenine-N6)-methyltransferase [Listeria welshimeri]MBC1463506.1 Dam family site-specific DNA-(adenine-N6)-methyltransferase [Listeria welshimeri]MBC2042001.1 Dam family site-specific DNA-(adenine-N6)-methyltransferase [Listeria welshimeri]MBF2471823.1 Dam family site-specific DNA-(adenine-N6)-methyltransferase [Listeria welshimeri]MBF2565549.1 Dam family site-specific DNA-(adenine-N6)-methyltransferase [Listeria welshimeri]MBF2686190.1 Dam family site-specific 